MSRHLSSLLPFHFTPFPSQITELRTKLIQSENDVTELMNQLTLAQSSLATLEARNATLTNNIALARESGLVVESRLAQEMDQLRIDLVVAEKRYRDFEEAQRNSDVVMKLKEQVEKLESSEITLRSTLQAKEDELSQWKIDAQVLADELECTVQQLKVSEAEVAKLRALPSSSSSSTLSASSSTSASVGNAVKAKEVAQVEELRSALVTLRSSYQDMQVKLEERQRETTDLSEEVESLRASLDDARAEAAAEAEESRVAKENIELLATRVVDMEVELHSVQSSKQALEALVSELKESMQSRMQAAKELESRLAAESAKTQQQEQLIAALQSQLTEVKDHAATASFSSSSSSSTAAVDATADATTPSSDAIAAALQRAEAAERALQEKSRAFEQISAQWERVQSQRAHMLDITKQKLRDAQAKAAAELQSAALENTHLQNQIKSLRAEVELAKEEAKEVCHLRLEAKRLQEGEARLQSELAGLLAAKESAERAADEAKAEADMLQRTEEASNEAMQQIKVCRGSILYCIDDYAEA